MRSLIHFEQCVNDRFETSAAPSITRSLLPEAGTEVPLKWRRVPAESVNIFSTGDVLATQISRELANDGHVLIPVHPLDEAKWPKDTLFTGGAFQVSASYRTVMYVPKVGDPLYACIPRDQLLMIKLHLDEPLPGVPGDRRLTRDKVEKCVLFSEAIAKATSMDPMADRLRIVPEFLGVVADNCGAIFRTMPSKGLIPAFSLGSRDSTRADIKPVLQTLLEKRFGAGANEAARNFGDAFARPFVRSLFAGIRLGFSLEMHAQNTLIAPGKDRLLDSVFYRDLEGVILSNSFRSSRNLPELFVGTNNIEIIHTDVSFSRYFNRNLDHDLGRIFKSVLVALRNSGYFDHRLEKIAVRSIRQTVRDAIYEADLKRFGRAGKFLPFSRAPYGNGTRLGHYYRTRFR